MYFYYDVATFVNYLHNIDVCSSNTWKC